MVSFGENYFINLSKRNSMKTFLALFFICSCVAIPAGQAASLDSSLFLLEKDTVPHVFLLGEYEEDFDELTLQHQTLLLTACEDDMTLAFGKWMSMVQEMEAYANLVNYDLDGIKMWLNVFWNQNGSVKHIAYFLKPNSKNVDTIELTRFMNEFISHYRFPLTYSKKFSHYGRVKKEKKPEMQNSTSDGAKSGE